MAEWVVDEGVGEHRAALVVDGVIVEAAIDRQDERLRAGAIVEAKLGKRVRGGAWVETAAGDAVLEAVPQALSEGRALHVEVVREAIPEPGRAKPPRVRASDLPLRAAPTLAERLSARRLGRDQAGFLEGVGWSALIEEAASGEIAFPGGALRLWPTPAMALFDVDGSLAAPDLAIAGARAAAQAVRRLAIGGAIGIDLPTVGAKAARAAAAAAIDDVLPQPFERTAVNGFGFVQIVRPRARASIVEIVRADPVLAATFELMRRAGIGHGPRGLAANPEVIARFAARGDWIAALSARVGGSVGLRADPALSISAGYVEPA